MLRQVAGHGVGTDPRESASREVTMADAKRKGGRVALPPSALYYQWTRTPRRRTRGGMMLLTKFALAGDEPAGVVELNVYSLRRRDWTMLALVALNTSMLGMMRVDPNVNAFSTF